MKNTQWPIFDWRTVIGYASTKKQAERVAMSHLQNIPDGFTVTCHMRDDYMCETSKLPKGWVYSIPHKKMVSA